MLARFIWNVSEPATSLGVPSSPIKVYRAIRFTASEE